MIYVCKINDSYTVEFRRRVNFRSIVKITQQNPHWRDGGMKSTVKLHIHYLTHSLGLQNMCFFSLIKEKGPKLGLEKDDHLKSIII